MTDDARKAVLVAWQQRKQETVTHPVTKEEIPLALVPHVQARLLARTLRPIMRRLFPDVPPEHPAMSEMVPVGAMVVQEALRIEGPPGLS